MHTVPVSVIHIKNFYESFPEVFRVSGQKKKNCLHDESLVYRVLLLNKVFLGQTLTMVSFVYLSLSGLSSDYHANSYTGYTKPCRASVDTLWVIFNKYQQKSPQIQNVKLVVEVFCSGNALWLSQKLRKHSSRNCDNGPFSFRTIACNSSATSIHWRKLISEST